MLPITRTHSTGKILFTSPLFPFLVALAAGSLGLGFCLGLYTSFGWPLPHNSNTPADSFLQESDAENEAEGENITDGDLYAVQAGNLEQCKLVLVVRTDLKMSPGKIAAQCGHATLACYKALVIKNPKLVRHWERTGQAKIALKGISEAQLMELEAIAKSLNLCARSIRDQGCTEVPKGSMTVLGVGPAPVALINQVTGKLRLL